VTLIVFLSPDLSDRASWVDPVRGESGEGTPLTALAARAAGRPVCAAIAGEKAVSRSFNLLMKRRRDQEKAAALLMEDHLAAPIEDRILALAPTAEGGRLVSAVPAAEIDAALALCLENGLDPDILTVDHALLAPPEADAPPRVVALGDRAMVRMRDGAATAEADLVSGLVPGGEAQALHQEHLIALPDVLNFRQGRFAKKRQRTSLRPFAAAAALLLAAATVFFLASVTESLRYARAADRLEQQAEAAFTAARPGTPVFDLERQIGNLDQNNATSSDFLPLTAALTSVLDGRAETVLTSINYSRDGQLTAELSFASFSELEEVSRELSALGIVAEEGGDARREDGALVTRLFLRIS
jgi:type II secretion system protein L